MATINTQAFQFSVAALIATAATSSHAGFVGLYAESIATNTLTNTTLVGTTYRIYAQFDDPGDRFLSVAFADLDFHTTAIFQDNAFGTILGPHNAALDVLIPNLAADSYVAVNDGMPSADPEFDAAVFAAGTDIVGGWFMSDPLSPANAPDANGRVLLMFLSFPGANHPQVSGIISTELSPNVYLSFTPLNQLILGDFWIGFEPEGGEVTAVRILMPLTPPSPGALGLFVMAGLFGRRRHRTEALAFPSIAESCS